jgi:outer membrane receptor protein involved in Fe transport
LEINENPTMEVFSPKVALSFRPSSDLMWYGLVSRGYRTGGTNTTFLLSQPDPSVVPDELKYYDTDNLWNYETGVRKSWAGGNVTTDFTLFYLDWTDIQLDAQYIHEIGLINAVFNTGKAHSLGVEGSISAQLARGLSFSTSFMWNEAELDEDTPPLVNNETGEVVIVPAGSKLPASPMWSTATTLQYFWDSTSWGYPFVAVEHFYKDVYVTYLPGQETVPSFNIFGLRVGATFANQWQLTLSVRNLLDERSATNFFPGGAGNVLPNVYPDTWWMTRPRTISLSIQKNF